MINYLIYMGIAAASATSLFVVIYIITTIIKYIKKNRLPKSVTFTDELIEKRMPFGFYVLCGAQGAGKTSLATAIMITDFEYHASERFESACKEVDELNRIDNTYDLHYPKSTYYSREPIALQGDINNGYYTQKLDISEFGLPSDTWHPKYLPKSSFVFFPELDIDLSCREWTKIPPEIMQAIKYVRHIDLTILADMQVFDRLEKGSRLLATDIFYVLRKNDKYKKYHWWSKHKYLSATTWHFLWIKPQILEQARALKNYGVSIPVENYFKNMKFIFNGNIHEKYDSYSGAAHWRLNISDFDSVSNQPCDMRRSSILSYCSSFGILPNGEISE